MENDETEKKNKRKVSDDLHVCMLNLLPKVNTLSSLVATSLATLCQYFKLTYDHTLLRVGVSHSMSAPYLVWSPWDPC